MLLERGCPGCAAVVTGVDRGRRRAICRSCLNRARPVGEIRCVPGLDRCGALFQYRDQIQRALLAGKYGARRDGLSHFGAMLGDLARELCFEFDAVTWVPASRRGRQQRGYDQGRVLAAALGRRVGAPARRLLGVERDRGRIGRAGHIGPAAHGGQTGRGRQERLSGPSPRAVRPVAGHILVIDDVITTGASMGAAAVALRSAGAAAVLGLAVAWTASDGEVSAGRPLTAATAGPIGTPGPGNAGDGPRPHSRSGSRAREQVVGDLWGSADRWG